MAVKLIETPSTPSPQYLEGLALSPSTLLSLPDHLRKTAIILCNLKEASANDVAARSGRARAAESDYLNQLVRMGFVKKKRKGRESYFFVE
jgi:predicted transcriptional regulator